MSALFGMDRYELLAVWRHERGNTHAWLGGRGRADWERRST